MGIFAWLSGRRGSDNTTGRVARDRTVSARHGNVVEQWAIKGFQEKGEAWFEKNAYLDRLDIEALWSDVNRLLPQLPVVERSGCGDRYPDRAFGTLSHARQTLEREVSASTHARGSFLNYICAVLDGHTAAGTCLYVALGRQGSYMMEFDLLNLGNGQYCFYRIAGGF